MKKINVIILLGIMAINLTSCGHPIGKKANDKKILDGIISEIFERPFEIDSLDYYDDAPSRKAFCNGEYGLSTWGDVEFSYNLGNMLDYDIFGSLIPNFNSLTVEKQTFETSVTASCSRFDYFETFTANFIIPSYRRYAGDMFFKEFRGVVEWSFGNETDNKENFFMHRTNVSSGHFYTYYEHSFSFEEKKYTYKIVKYEKSLGDPYNVESIYHYYYFGSDERYEGEDYTKVEKGVNILKNIFNKYNDYELIG